jgi:Domain of unknown function (DUF2017)
VKVSRRHGHVRLHLDPAEAELLARLFDELDALLDGAGDPDDEVLRRLFPAAYPQDERAEAEYRQLTETTLRAERSERIAACRAELATSTDVELADPDSGRRWIQALNDLRLALGTRLGVTEDDDREVDPGDPAAQPWLVYYWLTHLQDSLVQGLMR